MPNSHPIIDQPWFKTEFSHHANPTYPHELRFWITSSEAQKSAAIRQNPGLWASGQGKNYLEALGKIRSINSRNKYWLSVLEKEMVEAGDHFRLEKVRECLSTYRDGQEMAYAGESRGETTPQWQD